LKAVGAVAAGRVTGAVRFWRPCGDTLEVGATEKSYSAWIEKLFDAPIDAAPSWKALHEVLRDKSRNVLSTTSASAKIR